MPKKICTSCKLTDSNQTILDKKAQWVKNTQQKHPPKEYIPNISNIIEINIDNGKLYAGRLIYYFAAESLEMLGEKYHLNILPDDAYDDYQNMGIARLDKLGKTSVYVNNPVSYFVEHDNKFYPPHIHYRIANKTNNAWMKTTYTVGTEHL